MAVHRFWLCATAITDVTSVALEMTCLGFVPEVNRENVLEPGRELGVLDGEENLDAAIEIARHQVRAAQIDLFRAAIPEVVNAAVLQESAHDAGDADVLADAGDPGRRQQMPRTSRSIFTPACDA